MNIEEDNSKFLAFPNDDQTDNNDNNDNNEDTITRTTHKQHPFKKLVLLGLTVTILGLSIFFLIHHFVVKTSSATTPTVPAIVTIDISQPKHGTSVSQYVLGINAGPHIDAQWIDHLPRQPRSGDWTAGMARVGVPIVRTHGMGCE